MLTRLLLLIIALAQWGCTYEYGDQFRPDGVSEEWRAKRERLKREFLGLEDLKVGDGPLAAWNRRVKAQLEVLYPDGSLVYQGPVFYYAGFYTMPDGSVYDKQHLASTQVGIRLGLNGMAVGGRRRMVIDRSLVCDTLTDYSDPRATCHLVGPGNNGPGVRVRKEQLLVEATLTESCVPVRLFIAIGSFIGDWEAACREEPSSRIDPDAPIWRFY